MREAGEVLHDLSEWKEVVLVLLLLQNNREISKEIKFIFERSD